MKITDSRANDILHWLDDEAGNHALLFEKMTLHRDAAALILHLQAELQDAWHAGLDAGREQGRGKDHAHQPPSVPVGVGESAERKRFMEWAEKVGTYHTSGYNPHGDLWRAWQAALATQPAAVVGVEQVAIAIAIQDIGVPWYEISPRGRTHYERLARAALSAQPGGSDNDH